MQVPPFFISHFTVLCFFQAMSYIIVAAVVLSNINNIKKK